ncbi:uncharacterized protein CMC5_060190 [Chondromyces crocatus]|uniref:Uncharacterized protein n=1 Tax=Chondromyces crocatus TaxID=52 RepID=A0A0K1EME9_CHOCO|nr:uncharacterized protein CMC5_060190 [Chondromyces crocatus]
MRAAMTPRAVTTMLAVLVESAGAALVIVGESAWWKTQR